MEDKKDIELRSGKVRSIIGKMPEYYLRYGTVTVIAVLAVLIGILSGIKSEGRIPLDTKLLISPQPYLHFCSGSSSIQNLIPSGTTVAKGDTLCIIGSNPILSPISGTLERYTTKGRTSPGELILTVFPDTVFCSAIIAEIPSSTALSLNLSDTLDLIFDSGEAHVASTVAEIYRSKAFSSTPILTVLLTPVSSSSLSSIRNTGAAEMSIGKQSILSRLLDNHYLF